MTKSALIFGHSSGLGLAVTEKLLEEGYKVIGISHSGGTQSDKLLSIKADLSKENDLQAVINQIKQDYSVFNVLIFCAGTLTAHDVDNLDYTDMEYVYRVNTFAPMFIESHLLELVKTNGADIVNITSSSIVDYYPKFTEYSSSKAAFSKFTKDLKRTLQETSSRVIDICPGGFASNIYKNMTGDKVDRDESQQMKASDLAGIIHYLISLPKKIEVSYVYIDRKDSN